MNSHPAICPARVSGVRERRHGDRMAFPAPSLRLDSADGPVVLRHLCQKDRDSYNNHRRLVFVAVHGRLLDVVSDIRRRLARVVGRTAVFAVGR